MPKPPRKTRPTRPIEPPAQPAPIHRSSSGYTLWFLDLCSIIAGFGLGAIFFFPRLPMSTDLILPRRGGIDFFRAVIFINQNSVLRVTTSWLAILSLFVAILAALAFIYRSSKVSWAQWKSQSGALKGVLLLGGLYLIWRLARFALSL